MAGRIKGITVEIGGDTTDAEIYDGWYESVYVPAAEPEENPVEE